MKKLLCFKRPELRVGRILYTSAHLNVIGINANGIRTARKRRLLRKLLRDLQVGLGIITETHLREEDLEGLRIRGYYRPAEYCRKTEIGKSIRGGYLSWRITDSRRVGSRNSRGYCQPWNTAHACCFQQTAQ